MRLLPSPWQLCSCKPRGCLNTGIPPTKCNKLLDMINLQSSYSQSQVLMPAQDWVFYVHAEHMFDLQPVQTVHYSLPWIHPLLRTTAC